MFAMAHITVVAAIRQASPGVAEIAAADRLAAIQAGRSADRGSAVHEHELHVALPNAEQETVLATRLRWCRITPNGPPRPAHVVAAA